MTYTKYGQFCDPSTSSIHEKNNRIRKNVTNLKTPPSPLTPISCTRHKYMVPYVKFEKNIFQTFLLSGKLLKGFYSDFFTYHLHQRAESIDHEVGKKFNQNKCLNGNKPLIIYNG